MNIETLKKKLKPSERISYYFAKNNKPYDLNKDITVSKIGGLPYWPKGKEYPTADGVNYKMVAQLNLDELNQEYDLKKISPYYPSTGILQFFLNEDDDCWEDTLVIYHPTYDMEHFLTESQISTSFNDEYIGYAESFRLSISCQSKEIVGSDDLFYQGFLKKDIKELHNEHILKLLRYETDEIPESYTSGTKIGGYTYFTQTDPLYNDSQIFIDQYPEELYPLVLLFQLDSDIEDMCWGDVGVLNWRIDIEDLKNLNFKNVFYNFDCH